MVTQKTIMERLGVSQSAVSCALSKNESVRNQISQELRNRIISEANRLNYKPRRVSKKTKSKNIALLDCQHSGNYCHPILVRSVQTSALESSYMLSHCFYDKNIGIPDELLDHVDGIISLEMLSPSELKLIDSRNIPFVLLNASNGAYGYDVVLPDHYSGLRKAMNCMYDMGHRKFAFFGLRDFGPHHAQRYGAFHQIIAELDIEEKPTVFIPYRGESSIRDVDEKVRGTLAAIAKMEEMPTALICAVDAYALSAIKLAPEFGIRVPEDMSIVGFDNIMECETCVPTLSSITLSLEAMGKVATSTLVRRINGDKDPVVTLKVDLEWIPRDSIAPPRNM